MSRERVPEALLARIWNDGRHTGELRTTTGSRVGIVYRGVWTHSNGPDFRDAMLEIDGRLMTGSVELHVRSADWFAHEHHLNPAYDDVILHVVLTDDAAVSCSGPGGGFLPTVEIEPFLPEPVETILQELPSFELGGLGQHACLPTLAGGRTADIHAVLRQEGWLRMREKQLRFAQELALLPPGEVLYRAILDSLGLSGNRAGMASVADAMPLVQLERIVSRHGFSGAMAALLGVGGFLPLSPTHAAFVDETGVAIREIERTWLDVFRESIEPDLAPPTWNLNRVRPLNHPARRLTSMASLLASVAESGPLARILAPPFGGGESWDAWLAAAAPTIGESRRRQIIVNSIAPFVVAYADLTENEDLLDAGYASWNHLPGSVDDDIARKTLQQITGGKRFPVSRAIEVQGLHRIGRQGCAHLRCFECPIAGLAVLHEPLIVRR